MYNEIVKILPTNNEDGTRLSVIKFLIVSIFNINFFSVFVLALTVAVTFVFVRLFCTALRYRVRKPLVGF